MVQTIITLCIVASGICWSIVYLKSIHIGFTEHTYAMPLFALGLNIVWEGLYAFTDLFIRQSIGAQAIANAAWFCLDIFILYTYFKYAREECQSETERKFFVPWTVLSLACCLVVQLLFYFHFGNVEGEKYSAYLQNIIMSVCYLYMLADRRSSRGQSMIIAVCKMIGTLTPTIYGTLEGNMFILVTGIVCFVFDMIYIFALREVIRREQAGELEGAAS